MNGRERLIAVATGAAAGFFGGLFGVGGGLVLVPLLTRFGRLTQHQAHGTSLAVIVFTAIAAGAAYAAHGNVAWGTGAIVGVASVLSAPLGAALTTRLSRTALARAFALFLIVVAIRLWWLPSGAAVATGGARVLVEIVIGLACGLVAGFLGVGGGIVAVPAFTLLLGMTQQLAQGTSLLVILGAATSGSWAHARRGHVAGRLVPWLAIGAIALAPLAGWSVQRLPHALLARAFAVVLVVNGALGLRRRTPATTPTATSAR